MNALDHALRKALEEFYPNLREMHLVDYKVRILDEASGTAAKTRVLITSADGEETWGTVGVACNIIDASWQALVDSVEYKLRRDERRGLRWRSSPRSPGLSARATANSATALLPELLAEPR